MNDPGGFEITTRWIKSHRGKKNNVDPQKPYAWLVEKERTFSGRIEETAVIFLTNRECPFHCLMCDLWKNTTDETSAPGIIPGQIEWALNQLPEVKHLKLYNSGSFFDVQAIPESDYKIIASIVNSFDTVIVESHPKFISKKSLIFRDMLKPALQIALGLETVNQLVLSKLNKQMTLEQFRSSAGFLSDNGIKTRAFILLKPPFLTEPEGVYWAERSIDFSFSAGVECCTVIPVRAGNGAMDKLLEKDLFKEPQVQSLERVLEYGINLNSGLVFADTWDLGLFSECNICLDARRDRITEMNLSQKINEKVECTCNSL